MSRFGGVPVSGGSKFGGVAVAPQARTATQKYAAEDAALATANEQANPLQQFATGVKTQTGRTMLGVNEFLQNADEALPAAAKLLPIFNAVPTLARAGRALFGGDAEVLAEAQREADRRDKGTGAAGFVGNVAGDFRNLIGGPAASAALKANTLRQALLQGLKVGAVSGAATGLTEGTGDADSTIADNLTNAAIGGGLGAAIGGSVPVLGTGVKKAAVAGLGGIDRALAFAGSDSAAGRVGYRNMADALTEQGLAPGEVASIIDGFRANGVEATLGQMTRSNSLLAREKNLLQGGGKASRVMSEGLADQRQAGTQALIDRANGLAQPEQTSYLYGQAARGADANPDRGVADALSQIEQDIALRQAELPSGVLAQVNRYIAEAKRDGGFEAFDLLKQRLSKLYKENSSTADQDIVNDAVIGWRRSLGDALDDAGGDTYRAAKTSSKRDMAAAALSKAAATTKTGNIKTALNKVFGTPEQQEEFLRKLPDDATRNQMREFFDQMDAAGVTSGGSDTNSLEATRAAMAGETGVGFNPKLDPTSLLERATAPLQRRVREQQAKAALKVDAGKLALAMRRGKVAPTAPGVKTRLAAKEATKAAAPPEEPTEITITPQDQLPPVNLPQVRRNDFLDRMAQAESSGDADAESTTSTASGLMQFTDGTWKDMVLRYGKDNGIALKDKNSPQAQRTMAALYAKQNAASLQKSLARPPSKGELYMAHVLGSTGARELIRAKNSGSPAALMYSAKVVKANKGLFFDGKTPRSAKDLYVLLNQKVS